MNFLSSIYQTLDSNDENQRAKGTFYSLINYLVVNDDSSNSGIKKKDLEERFSLRNEFSSILQLLQENQVVHEEMDDKYKLNNDAKQFISPLLKNLLTESYKDKYTNNCKERNEICEENPQYLNYKMLMDCRSQLFSS